MSIFWASATQLMDIMNRLYVAQKCHFISLLITLLVLNLMISMNLSNVCLLLLVLISESLSSQVGIAVNPDDSTPHPSSILELKSNSLGFLPPRMSQTERDAIPNPPEGLQLFNTTTGCINFRNDNKWFEVCGICTPQPSIASAGPDQPNVPGNTTTLAAQSPASGTGMWTIVSGSGGSFEDPEFANGAFTGTIGQHYVLRWTVSTECTSTQDDMVVNFVWTCGFPITDSRDNTVYNTTLIGSQCWMAQNLAYLPVVHGVSSGSTSVAHYYVLNYDGTNVAAAKATAEYNLYGALYNWPAAMNGQPSTTSNPSAITGICPSGWHLPSDAEWCQMENAVEPGMDPSCSTSSWRGTQAGDRLKNSSGWPDPENNGSNTTGFAAVPSGIRTNAAVFNPTEAIFYTATQNTTTNSQRRSLGPLQDGVFRGGTGKDVGAAVRCVKN